MKTFSVPEVMLVIVAILCVLIAIHASGCAHVPHVGCVEPEDRAAKLGVVLEYNRKEASTSCVVNVGKRDEIHSFKNCQ